MAETIECPDTTYASLSHVERGGAVAPRLRESLWASRLDAVRALLDAGAYNHIRNANGVISSIQFFAVIGNSRLPLISR